MHHGQLFTGHEREPWPLDYHVNPNLINPPPTPDQTNGGPTVGSSPTNETVPLFLNPWRLGRSPSAYRYHRHPRIHTWTSLDMGGINIKNLPPTYGLFEFTFLINLCLNRNTILSVAPERAPQSIREWPQLLAPQSEMLR